MTGVTIVEPGGTTRELELVAGRGSSFGKTAPADCLIADPSLADVHFSLSFKDGECLLRDHAGGNATLLDGAPVRESTIKPGACISAGQCRFYVSMEQEPELSESQERVLTVLQSQPQPLFALLDAARDDAVFQWLRRCGWQHQSLYEGNLAADLELFAPYLVAIANKENQHLRRLVALGWGKSWGYYLTAPAGFPELRRHLRHFLKAEIAPGKAYYFRFYDPRVLRPYLPTCNPDETRQFFGPVTVYLLEGDDPGKLLCFRHEDGKLIKQVINLEHKRPSEP
jgi:hypothetical protein